jgi:hypothetical protein
MKNRGITERALLKAFIMALGVGAMAHAGLGYLPLAGPPPLRMVAAKNPPTDAAPWSLAADTNFAVTLSAAEAINMPTNSLAALGETNSTDDVLPIGLGAGNVSDDPFSPAVLGMAPPELLNISPQMLTAYFHPVARGTNTAANVIAPMPVMFMPPQVQTLQPSSHAEYIVK